MQRPLSRFLTVCLSITVSFLSLPSNADQLIPYQFDGKIGYVDENMMVKIPASWDYGSYFRNGEVAVVCTYPDAGEPRYGLINPKGTFLVPIGDHRILEGEGGDYFGGEDGYYLIFDYSSRLFGYYDIRNHYYASPKYTSIDPHFRDESVNNMLFVGGVMIDGKEHSVSYINSATEDVICEFDYLEHGNPYHGKVLCEDSEGNYWIQFGDGTRISIDGQFKLESFFIGEGLFIISNDEGYNLMSLSGKTVAETHYHTIEYDPYDHCYYGTDFCGKVTIVYAEIPKANNPNR